MRYGGRREQKVDELGISFWREGESMAYLLLRRRRRKELTVIGVAEVKWEEASKI